MLEIAAVVLVYAGGLTVLVGLAGLAKPLRFLGLRRRRAGALVLGAGLTWIRSPRLGSGPSGSPRYARTTMNFLVDEEGEGWCRLGTETRVLGTDDSARQRFAVYGRVIYPGRALIRRMWLQAIKRRAEAS